MSGRRSTTNSLRTGSRVQYTFVSNGEKKRIPGQIVYGPGPFHLKPNENDWCGVVLEEPFGKNNGTIQGRQYFECPDNFGVFVRASTLRAITDSSRLSYPRSGSTTPSTTPSMTPSSSIASFTGMFDSGHSPTSKPMTESVQPVPVSKIKPPTRLMSASATSIEAIKSTGIPTSSKDTRSIRKMVEKIETKRDEKLREQIDTQDISTQNVGDCNPREVLELQEKVKDLESKLNTLMVKRAEDRAKFKDFERLKIQNEQLLENKKQMSEKCAELSKQKQLAEKEGREAREEQLRQSEEIKDLVDSAEMAVIDKEMAENKAEQLQIELEQTKEQLEEAKIDFELLKSEIEDKGVDGAANSFQLKQLEEQNARFKDALLKFRDITAGDRNNIMMLQKEVEQKSEELNQLMAEKDKNRNELEKCYGQIEELKEQVDIALGSQEMVERLTEKNLAFEDKVEELQKALDEEENIKELSNMIIEEKDEIIADLRDEVDKYKTNLVNLTNTYLASQEAVKDHECTIHKFRELVSALKEENRIHRTDKAQDMSKVQQAVDVQKQLENIEFKARLLDRRDLSKSIDMELRQLDVDQCYRYMVYLARFFPESFFVRGGDHDAIAVLMFVPRIFAKCSILERQIVEKQLAVVTQMAATTDGANPATTPESILREIFGAANTNGATDQRTIQLESLDKLKQQIFTKHILYLLCSIRSILGKYQDVLSKCDSELFMKIGSLFSELSVHEKSIDHYVDLLRSDKLDDTVALDSLEKTLSYLQSLYNIYMATSSSSVPPSSVTSSPENNHNKLLNDLLEVLRTGVDATFIDVKILSQLTIGEVSMFVSGLETTLNDIDQFVRKIRRRMVSAGSGSADTNPACILHFPPVIEAELFDSSNNLSMIVRCLKTIRATAMAQFLEQMLSTSESGGGVSAADGDTASAGSNNEANKSNYFSMDDLEKISKELTGNSLKSLAEMLTTVMGSISKFCTSLQQGDYDVCKSSSESGMDSLGPQSLSGPLSGTSSSALLTMQHFNSLSSIQSLFSSTNSANQNRTSLQTMLCLPLDDRALKWRAQTDQIGEYRSKISIQEADIAELKRALKIKIDEVSEMQIRRDIAEKKFGSAQAETNRVQEELDRLVKEFNEKEAEREKTLNKYNQEINELYSDHRMMKEKLKDYSKHAGNMIGGSGPGSTTKMMVGASGIGSQSTPNTSSLLSQTSSLGNLSLNTSPVHSFHGHGNHPHHHQYQYQHPLQQQHSTPSSTTSPFQSMIYSGIQQSLNDPNELQRQVNDLRDALKRMAKRNYQLRMLTSSEKISSASRQHGPYAYCDNSNNLNAKPLWYIESLRSAGNHETLQETMSEFNLIPDMKELKMQELRNKLIEFKYDFWRHRCETSSLVLPSLDKINKSKPGWSRCIGDLIRKSSQQESLKELQFVRRFEELKKEIGQFIQSYDDGYACQATYTSFMATHVTKALESKPQLVARITVPSSCSAESSNNQYQSPIPIEVTFAELQKLHATLMF